MLSQRVTIRSDLKITKLEGRVPPAWIIYDPAVDEYFKLGWVEFEILKRWQTHADDELIQDISLHTSLVVDTQDIMDLQNFLIQNNLVIRDNNQMIKELVSRQEAIALNKKKIKKYFFLTMPIFYPQNFLKVTQWLWRPFFSKYFLFFLFFGFLSSLFLIIRNFSHVSDEFIALFQWQNTGYLFLSIFISQMIHEFGHAMVARFYGCRVNHIGVAFLFGWPVLYTDISNMWQLSDRKKRLLIDAGGLMAEMALAIIALMLWFILDPSPIRHMIFFIATSSWIISVGVNINPFIRFDGYYILSDWLDIDNLQTKSGRFLTQKWREFALGTQSEFVTSQKKALIYTIYGISSWFVRLSIYLGIAALVYGYLFKIFGFLLALTVIWQLIIEPMGKEMMFMIKNFQKASKKRKLVVISVGLVLCIISLIPYSRPISLPVAQTFESVHYIYASESGQLNHLVKNNLDSVEVGELLGKIEKPSLQKDIQISKEKIENLKARLQREFGRVNFNLEATVDQEVLREQETILKQQEEELKKLDLKTQIKGTFSTSSEYWKKGQWVPKDVELGKVVDLNQHSFTAYANDRQLKHLKVNQSGKLYFPSYSVSPLKARIKLIEAVNQEELNEFILSQDYGGQLFTMATQGGNLKLLTPLYKIQVLMEDGEEPSQFEMRGDFIIWSMPESLAYRAWQALYLLLVRELSF